MDIIKKITVTAPINIATVKYWGKKDEANIIPLHNSISLTLDQEQLHTKTTIIASKEFSEHKLLLNGKDAEITKRIKGLIQSMSEHAKRLNCPFAEWKVHMESTNNFPTAAGMASSASGMAAMAFGLAKLYGVEEKHISIAARLGSGSACRSVYGGFVEWVVPEDPAKALDSGAVQLFPDTHWPNLCVLICVSSEAQKAVGSTPGMQLTVANSALMKTRVSSVVPQHLDLMRKALTNHDFAQFAEVTMRESNQLHAVCLDTWPPIMYLNDVSRSVIRLVLAVNEFYGRNVLAYTFDAGTNAFIFCLEEHANLALRLVRERLAGDSGMRADFVRGIIYPDVDVSQDLLARLPVHPDGVQFVISTKVGPGPRIVG